MCTEGHGKKYFFYFFFTKTHGCVRHLGNRTYFFFKRATFIRVARVMDNKEDFIVGPYRRVGRLMAVGPRNRQTGAILEDGCKDI